MSDTNTIKAKPLGRSEAVAKGRCHHGCCTMGHTAKAIEIRLARRREQRAWRVEEMGAMAA